MRGELDDEGGDGEVSWLAAYSSLSGEGSLYSSLSSEGMVMEESERSLRTSKTSRESVDMLAVLPLWCDMKGASFPCQLVTASLQRVYEKVFCSMAMSVQRCESRKAKAVGAKSGMTLRGCLNGLVHSLSPAALLLQTTNSLPQLHL